MQEGISKLRLLKIVAGAVMATAIACAPASQPTAPTQPGTAPAQKGEQPKYGGTLRTPNQYVAPSFDLITEGTNGTWLPTVPTYNSLLQYDVHDFEGYPSRILPDLAEKWDVSKDGTMYTFYLRKGVKFHDGVEFTAADAKFSLERIMDPPPKTPSLRQGWYKGTITKMETPDKYTFIVHVKEPYAAFLKLIATTVTPMVPKHILEPHNGRIADIKLVVGTGPFKLVEGDRTVGYKLAKNEEYYRKDRPFLDAIDMPVILEEASRVAAFRAGRLDALLGSGPNKPGVEGLKRDMGDKVVIQETLTVAGTSPVWFNSGRKPFDDVRVRRAVFLGIDKPAVLKIGYDGVGCVGGFYAPAGEWGRSCQEWAKLPGWRSPTSEDLALSKKLLVEAGYAGGFDLKCNTGFNPGTDRTCELMVEMLKPLGINVTIRNLERTAFYAALNNADFEIVPMGIGLNIDDPNDFVGTQYITKAGRNYGFFSDSMVDELFQKQSREMDLEKRKQLARQLEDRLIETMPAIPVVWGGGFTIHYLYVKGYRAIGGRLNEQRNEHVWLDK